LRCLILQNQPHTDGDDTGDCNFFVVPDGWTLLSLDLSQIELRVAAFYCRDEFMFDTYRFDVDIYASITCVIYHIPIEEAVSKNKPPYKTRRTISKNRNFDVVYGLYP
jgi:DNA polymerase-1